MSKARGRSSRHRRESIYQREWERYGMVPCFVCKKHVKRAEATLEHIWPKALGGTNSGKNLAISHERCNTLKGHKVLFRQVSMIADEGAARP